MTDTARLSGSSLGPGRRLWLVLVAGLLLCPGVAHAAAVEVGSFVKTTGAAPVAQVVAHGLGETPKAIILWTTGNTNQTFAGDFHYAFGMSDGTTSGSTSAVSHDLDPHANSSRRIAAKALTVVEFNEVLLAEADLQSWDATNFTLNWTTNDATAAVVHFIAIGGAGVSAKVVNWTMPTAAGNQAVTGVGFVPDVVLHTHGGPALTANPSTIPDGVWGLGVMAKDGSQWANTFVSDDPSTLGNTQRYQRANRTLVAIDFNQVVRKEASFVSMDANGFTVNFTTANASASQVYSLALKGVSVKAGSFNKTTGAAPATQAITGLNFRPRAVLLSSFQDVTQGAPVTETRFGIGAADASTGGSLAFTDEDVANPKTNVNAIDKTSRAFMKVDNNSASIDAEASLTSLDAGGFTLNWTTNDAVATEMLYLAFTPRRRIRIW